MRFRSLLMFAHFFLSDVASWPHPTSLVPPQTGHSSPPRFHGSLPAAGLPTPYAASYGGAAPYAAPYALGANPYALGSNLYSGAYPYEYPAFGYNGVRGAPSNSDAFFGVSL